MIWEIRTFVYIMHKIDSKNTMKYVLGAYFISFVIICEILVGNCMRFENKYKIWIIIFLSIGATDGCGLPVRCSIAILLLYSRSDPHLILVPKYILLFIRWMVLKLNNSLFSHYNIIEDATQSQIFIFIISLYSVAGCQNNRLHLRWIKFRSIMLRPFIEIAYVFQFTNRHIVSCQWICVIKFQ